jgi:CelD/BcsL family acetyltransferase involved in cellulose biosynthesis
VLTELELHDRRWAEFVTSEPRARVFHHPAWATMLSECYNFRAFALTLVQDDRVRAGFPVLQVKRPFGIRRWVSLPFTDICPPLCARTGDTELVRGAAEAARQAGIGRIEVHAPMTAPGVYTRAVAVMHTLDLQPDPEAIRRSFNKSQVQRNINRAEREPVVVRHAEAAGDLTKAFYRLHVRTRRKQGVPVQPRRFFKLLWDRVLEPGLGFLLLAYSGTTPVAGGVFLAWNGTVIYKYGASDTEHLKLRPNHLIFWHAIRWACENGFHTFDFGRSDFENRGLREFKNGWATREEPLRYSGVGGAPLGLPSRRAQRAIGGVIQRSPLWMTRALGEALYPFVA